MSGDVQPRKRKDKRRKKGQLEARRSEEYLEESTVFKQGYAAAQIQDIPLHLHHADSTATKGILKPDDEEIHHTTSGSDEIIHVQKDSRLGGNICAKIVFFCLLGALGVMIGLILTEYRGSSDVETKLPMDSPWSQMLEGWVDDSVDHHDEVDSHGVDHDHEELGEEDIHSEEEKSGEDEDHENEQDHEDESEEEDEIDEEDSDEDKDEDDVSEENVSNEVGQDDDEDVDNESAEDEDEDDQDHDEEEEDDVDDDDDDDEEENESLSDEEDQFDSKENEDESQENEEDNESIDESVRAEEEDNESIEEQDEKDQTDEEGEEEEDTNESREEEEEESYEETINEGTNEESEEKEGEDDEDSIEAATAEKMKEYEAQMKEQEEEEEDEEEEEETPKIIEEDEAEDEEEQAVVEEVENQGKPDELPGEGEAQVEEEEETTGVALKFGVGVALVVVAHVVLVRKWNRCGEEGIEQAKNEIVSEESVTEVPDLTRRQTLIPPSVEPPVTSPPAEQLVTEEYEYSEQEYEDEEEEEDEKHVMETLEDLKAKYQQMTPEDSDVEPEEEEFASKPTYTPTPPHSEPEEEQSEVEEEEEEEEEEDDPLAQWKSVRGREMLAEEVEEVQTGSESEEEEPPPVPIRRGGPRSSDEQIIDENVIEENVVEQEYVNADITNSEDWEFREELDLADAELNNGKPEIALKMFSEILIHHPHSPRAYHGKAQALDQLAEAKRSNQLLVSAISTYLEAVELPNIPDKLFLLLTNRTIDRMRFKGMHMKAVAVHHKLIHRFHNDPWHRNQLAVNYMMINRLADAELVLEQTRQRWPSDGLTQAYYGLVLKLRGKHVESIPFLRAGINSQAEGTTDSHFYFHLGDALSRQNKTEEAMQVYAKGVDKGLFRSVYQRSLYNVDRLKAQPWWTIEETTYAPFFKKLEENWKVIRDEGLSALKAQVGFEDEAESLRDTGNWKQFELFARGQKYQKNCERTPITCRLIEDFPPANGCRRGQTKFSVMEGGTHVWPHCGPTNCRLRAHLGLIIPNGTAIRVAEDTRNWAEGKVFIFDDSFEHEVWHKGTEKRLVLIVDVWHPELTPNERATLTTI